MRLASSGHVIEAGWTTMAASYETKITEWRREIGMEGGMHPTVKPAPVNLRASLEETQSAQIGDRK
jgi:hypothetical protein